VLRFFSGEIYLLSVDGFVRNADQYQYPTPRIVSVGLQFKFLKNYRKKLNLF
jgi:hypothetical protein